MRDKRAGDVNLRRHEPVLRHIVTAESEGTCCGDMKTCSVPQLLDGGIFETSCDI